MEKCTETLKRAHDAIVVRPEHARSWQRPSSSNPTHACSPADSRSPLYGEEPVNGSVKKCKMPKPRSDTSWGSDILADSTGHIKLTANASTINAKRRGRFQTSGDVAVLPRLPSRRQGAVDVGPIAGPRASTRFGSVRTAADRSEHIALDGVAQVLRRSVWGVRMRRCCCVHDAL